MDFFERAEMFGVFPSAVAAGMGVGAVLSAVAVVRILIPHGKILSFVSDFLCVVFFGLVLYIFSTGLTGEIRYYSLFGMLAGCGGILKIGDLTVMSAARKISKAVQRKIVAPAVAFITKIVARIKSGFVKTA